jgi:glutathione peroxidase
MTIYDQRLRRLDGTEVSLQEFRGKVLLIVNVASKCGLTPQYEGLEALYMNHRDQGLVVLGFPANEFLGQEPGTSQEIQQFCNANFGVDFPMFEKLVVKGEGQHPLYTYLTETKPVATQKPGGTLLARLKEKNLLSGKPNDVKWNFEKFLVNRRGEIVERFSPDIEPLDPLITKAVERELAAK